MAKLNLPLHSLKARGTIGKYLTFSERKSGSQVRWQKKQKDVITEARINQRAKFLLARDSWLLQGFGVYNFGFFLCGGKEIEISSLPKKRRAPKFACYVSDFLS